MSKKLTLNETWEYCLSMWRWIAKQRRARSRSSVPSLKRRWLEYNWSGKDIDGDCFFCDYGLSHTKTEDNCDACPAQKIDPEFHCMCIEYDYQDYPIAFYNKLVSLNRKRLKKKSHSKPAQRKAAE